MVVEARAVSPGQTGVNPPGTALTIIDGDVMLDGSADVRSTLDLTVDGVGMWPYSPSDLLAPYGQELFIRRGVAFGNGTVEWVSLGYFRIETPEQDRAPDGPIRISGKDRMAGLIEARLLAPVPFASTDTFGSVVSDLVTEVYPSATIEWDDSTSSQQLGRAVIAEDDRYKFLDDLIASAGKVWAWDHRGVLTISTPPATSSPVFDVSHGTDGVLVSLSRRLSRDGVYNAVVATGEGADTTAPQRAVAIDNDPDSPTYWYGNFGKVPRFYSSPLLTSATRAQSAASTILRKHLGVPYAVDFSAVPNPALEPFDPVRVIYPGRAEVHVLDRLTIPLSARNAMTGSTRVQASDGITFL